MISLIAAIGENRELGKAGQLLWHLPKDFTYFKEKTLDTVIIMGRKTFESIGRPLPRRTSIVITSQEDWGHDGVIAANSMPDAISKAKELNKDIFVIGGGDVYRQSLPFVDIMYLTEVQGVFPYADTFFPEFSKNEWHETTRTPNKKDAEHDYDFDFVIYKKSL